MVPVLPDLPFVEADQSARVRASIQRNTFATWEELDSAGWKFTFCIRTEDSDSSDGHKKDAYGFVSLFMDISHLS